MRGINKVCGLLVPAKHVRHFRACQGPLSRIGYVLVLDAPLALGVDEAAAAAGAAGALLAAEVGLLRAAAALVLADAAADAEEDGRDEEAGECGPGEAVGVAAEAGILSGGAEGVAADDGPGAVVLLVNWF